MKRFLAILALVLLLAGCQKNGTSEKKPDDAGSQKPSLSERIDELDKAGTFYKAGTVATLIAEQGKMREENPVYEIDELASPALGKDGSILGGGSFGPYMLQQYNFYNPISNLEFASEDIVYTRYALKDTHDRELTAYVFFERLDGNKEDEEIWWITGRVFYVYKVLSSADFASIAVGSNFTEVEAIDPAASLQYPETVTENTTGFSSYHYLTDGILKVRYEKEADGSFAVSKQELISDFSMPGNTGDVYLRISLAG